MATVLGNPLLRVPLMFANIYSSIIVSKDPNPSTTAEEQQKYKDGEIALDNYWTMKGWLFKLRRASMYGLGFAEVYVLLSQAYPPLRIPLLESLIPSLISPYTSNVGVTPTFLIASTLIHAGALIRSSCYRTLGHLFTFDLSIRKDHKLITTGPYAFVRHPSYLGSMLFFPGLSLTLLGRGSWMRECVLSTGSVWGKLLAADIVLYLVWTTFYLIRRTGREDKALKEQFGEEWERWAERTRYKLIPYVY